EDRVARLTAHGVTDRTAQASTRRVAVMLVQRLLLSLALRLRDQGQHLPRQPRGDLAHLGRNIADQLARRARPLLVHARLEEEREEREKPGDPEADDVDVARRWLRLLGHVD